MQPMQDMHICDDPKKGLNEVWSLVGACSYYLRHIHNYTYSLAPHTDLMKKTNLWRWTNKEDACFQEFRKKISSANC